MREETLSSADCADAFLAQGMASALRCGEQLRERGVRHLEVLGRGSSSHAGTLLRYALAEQGGLGVSAAMPSLAANAQALSHLRGNALVAISQSGKSPDLVRYASAARAAGAYVVALTNTGGSALGAGADVDIALGAGPERAVAATKSVILSMFAGLGMAAGYHDDTALRQALTGMPARLREAACCDWSALGALLVQARAVYVLGRGADLGVAKEIALKIAEAVGVPALAFSSAEFMHGPLGAVSAQTPVLGIAARPGDFSSVRSALEHARAMGAPTLLAHGQSAQPVAADLALPAAQGTLADCLLALVPAYLAIEAAALRAGRNPDQPRGLSKVTETL